MKRFSLYGAGLFLLTLCVLPLSAQHAPGQWGFSLSTGAVKLIGGEIDKSTITPAAGLGFSLALSQRVDLVAIANLGWVRPRSATSHFQNAPDAPYRTYLFPWAMLLRYRIIPEGLFCPYISGGAGMTHWHLRNVSQEDNWFPIPQSGSSVSGAQANATIHVAAGFCYALSKTVSLELEGRYGHMLLQDIDNIGLNDVNTGIISANLSLGIHFGGRHDSDGDGILDKVDGAPYRPEDVDGFQDLDGIPDLDNDGDGIPDLMDQAPNQPEDIDGFQDEDGIPDLDNDKDGVPDVYDKAPLIPEDIDGFEDRDGVPDPDNDGDGIPDVDDPDPNHKPIPKVDVPPPPPADKKEGPPLLPPVNEAVVLSGVNFSSGSAGLTVNAEKLLGEVLRLLQANPGIEVEIRGFTDSSGNAAANLNLSQRRAEAVRLFLLSRGIAETRLRAVGYGEANPLASNSTAEGRARNRRIEMVVLE